MKFQIKHKFFDFFGVYDESDMPDWLTSKKTIPGSTMDYRWFYTDHVLTLGVGETVETDFNRITRIE